VAQGARVVTVARHPDRAAALARELAPGLSVETLDITEATIVGISIGGTISLDRPQQLIDLIVRFAAITAVPRGALS